jgi:methyl-accepting chemotaxis protein
MTTTPTPKPNNNSQSVIDSIKEGAVDLTNSAAEKLQAVKDLYNTVKETNETFRKVVDSNEKVTASFFSTITEAMKAAQSPEERERLMKMGQETVKQAAETSAEVADKAFELAKGAVIVLGVIAAGTAAILYAKSKSE